MTNNPSKYKMSKEAASFLGLSNPVEVFLNKEVFQQALTALYRDAFLNNPDYAYSASKTTPELLAEKMTKCLLEGSANKDGECIKKACKIFGIKHTYKAIKEFLSQN